MLPEVTKGLSLNFEDSASPKEEQLVGEVHEISPVPHPGGEEEGGEVEEEAVPVPDEFEGVKDIVEYGEGGEGLIWVLRCVQKM